MELSIEAGKAVQTRTSLTRLLIEDQGRLNAFSSSARPAAVEGAAPPCFASATTNFLSSAAVHDLGNESRSASLRL